MKKRRTAALSKNIDTQRIFFFSVCLISLLAAPYVAWGDTTKTDPLLIGTGPYYYTDKLKKGFTPLVEYLGEKLDREVQLIITKNYEELADKVESGAIDIGFFSPVLYVQLKQRYPQLKYLVTSQTTQGGKNTAYYFSWLVARKDSGVTKVKHLRGKTFAFTNKHSSSGYIYPQGYFHWHHLAPKGFFSRVVFAGTHEKVTDMIARREVETGVSYDANLWSAEEKYGRIFRRIKRIGPILNPSFAAGADVDDILCERIVFALENIPLEVLNENLIYTGFRQLSETNFTVVAELLETVEESE
ncbi:MAG: phosphate/phosphite/phosphonate ABC transporter substrate-binding protein [Candidatus Electrothrix communis]|nr:phosphate/phosphite/phosphonate ABC transporter substrate-binding protein [Desulfobulbus sp. US4]WLE96597.1 MAG: phosphate/phosphite/phosphonate ABC transporter substrate-binding protein [Candidatus Electrothrix communis]